MRIAWTFLLLFVFSFQVNAQSLSFKGRVLDPSEAPIAGARLTASHEAWSASAVSDERGEFLLTGIPEKYALRISAPGFTEQSVELDEFVTSRVFTLQLPGIEQVVMVTDSFGDSSGLISSATKTWTPLRDIPQAVTVVTQQQARDQAMMSIGDVVRYIPGITAVQGENNRDQMVIRGNSSSADFFVNGVRDDVQYYRDLYNLERVEALKGPNAMIFGRGGGGGVINRVTKDAEFVPIREMVLSGGSFNGRRVAIDVDQPVNSRLALRMNGMFEDSGSFRKYVHLQRRGISPAMTFAATSRTRLNFGFENFKDTRVADRGVPSFHGRPVDTDISTYYGNPGDSRVRARVNLSSLSIEHQEGRLTIRNRTQAGDYDRFYQNFVPGAVTADRSSVSISAYNNATHRRNVFNQTDFIVALATGRFRHAIVSGVELGRQATRNYRNTGYFNNTSLAFVAPFDKTAISTPVTFRQSATDADNRVRTYVAATYVQDQIEVSRHLQLVSGIRFDRFELRYRDNRNSDELRRTDRLVSPRVGVVVKPIVPLSIYVSYSVSHLPSSGDQFSSLTTITQQVKPEKFSNYEMGMKWDLRNDLSLTSAVYRLDRTNTRTLDPNDPTRIVQTGSQRTSGFELGANGRVAGSWKVTGGYAYQNAFVTSATIAARAGARVGQVPLHTLSIWNSYQVIRRVGVGLGIVRRSDMFAAIDNTVVLPAYTRADGAVYLTLNDHIRLQGNAENLFDQRYYLNADNNTNISPGSGRGLRFTLSWRP